MWHRRTERDHQLAGSVSESFPAFNFAVFHNLQNLEKGNCLMLIGEMITFEHTLREVLAGVMPGYINSGLSAHLMSHGDAPDVSVQQSLADIAGSEITGQDYGAVSLTGLSVDVGDGKVSIKSDAILFGDPITMPPFRYLLLASGLPGAAASSKKLVAYCDLATNGGVREVIRGSLVFSHGVDGWLSFSPPQS